MLVGVDGGTFDVAGKVGSSIFVIRVDIIVINVTTNPTTPTAIHLTLDRSSILVSSPSIFFITYY